MRRRELLNSIHQARSRQSGETSDSVIRWPGIANNALEMAAQCQFRIFLISSIAPGSILACVSSSRSFGVDIRVIVNELNPIRQFLLPSIVRPIVGETYRIVRLDRLAWPSEGLLRLLIRHDA